MSGNLTQANSPQEISLDMEDVITYMGANCDGSLTCLVPIAFN